MIVGKLKVFLLNAFFLIKMT